jgi:hypothetical protein
MHHRGRSPDYRRVGWKGRTIKIDGIKACRVNVLAAMRMNLMLPEAPAFTADTRTFIQSNYIQPDIRSRSNNMKCNICDATLSEPKHNPDVRGSFDPCDFCMAVVEDTLTSYIDKPAADESEFGGPDPIFEALYPQSYDPFGTEE